jgi:hypothetical protein
MLHIFSGTTWWLGDNIGRNPRGQPLHARRHGEKKVVPSIATTAIALTVPRAGSAPLTGLISSEVSGPK